MHYVVWGLIALLAVLHQDFWFWDDARLLWGILPMGLAYHVALSLAAAATWWLAIRWAWPQFADDPQAAASAAAADHADPPSDDSNRAQRPAREATP